MPPCLGGSRQHAERLTLLALALLAALPCSVEFVEERRCALDRYLQELLAHEELSREPGCGGVHQPCFCGWDCVAAAWTGRGGLCCGAVMQAAWNAGRAPAAATAPQALRLASARSRPVGPRLASLPPASAPPQAAPTSTSFSAQGPSCTSWPRRSSSPRAHPPLGEAARQRLGTARRGPAPAPGPLLLQSASSLALAPPHVRQSEHGKARPGTIADHARAAPSVQGAGRTGQGGHPQRADHGPRLHLGLWRGGRRCGGNSEAGGAGGALHRRRHVCQPAAASSSFQRCKQPGRKHQPSQMPPMCSAGRLRAGICRLWGRGAGGRRRERRHRRRAPRAQQPT